MWNADLTCFDFSCSVKSKTLLMHGLKIMQYRGPSPPLMKYLNLYMQVNLMSPSTSTVAIAIIIVSILYSMVSLRSLGYI